jgi:AcrR family transcriptional regulator
MMNINAPSLYAAFGSKEKLYQEVVQLYGQQYASRLSSPLNAPGSVREAIRNTLYAAARSFSNTDTPPGCLFASGMLHCASEHAGAAQLCAAQRKLALQAITQRIEQAQSQGEISSSSNSRALAGLYAAVIQGMSVQAIDGASFNQLCELADAAMLAWPHQDKEHTQALTTPRT